MAKQKRLDPDNAFMDFNNDENMAESSCGCVMKRRDEGGGTEFHMCDTHNAATDLLSAAKYLSEDLHRNYMPKWKVKKDFSALNGLACLDKAIAQAEGK